MMFKCLFSAIDFATRYSTRYSDFLSQPNSNPTRSKKTLLAGAWSQLTPLSAKGSYPQNKFVDFWALPESGGVGGGGGVPVTKIFGPFLTWYPPVHLSSPNQMVPSFNQSPQVNWSAHSTKLSQSTCLPSIDFYPSQQRLGQMACMLREPIVYNGLMDTFIFCLRP